MSDLKEELEALNTRIDDALGKGRETDFATQTTVDPARLQLELTRLQLEASQKLIATMSATLTGECRRERPFKPLQPVIDEDGVFKWCCTHTPPHCSGS